MTWYVIADITAHTVEDDEPVWTLSRNPDKPGWGTDMGCRGYGLKRADAQELANAANAMLDIKKARTQQSPGLTKVTKWEGFDGRPETRPMQFGDDWPGVFIRGDDALAYATALNAVKQMPPNENISGIWQRVFVGLESLLSSCDMSLHREKEGC